MSECAVVVTGSSVHPHCDPKADRQWKCFQNVWFWWVNVEHRLDKRSNIYRPLIDMHLLSYDTFFYIDHSGVM